MRRESVRLISLCVICIATLSFGYLYEYTSISKGSRMSCSAPVGENSIHGKVFEDDNADGVINGNEEGYASAIVHLYQDADSNNIPDGLPLLSTTTDINGDYHFDTALIYLEPYSYDMRIQSNTDDAHEEENGDVKEFDNDIKVGRSNKDRYGGFRFVNLNIPTDAIIDSAYLIIDNGEGFSRNSSIDIFAEEVSNPNAFSDINDLSTRSLTSNFTKFDINWAGNESDYKSPDISSVIQEVVTTVGGFSELALILQNNTSSADEIKIMAHDDQPSKAARLQMYYSVLGNGPFVFLTSVDMASMPLRSVQTTTNYQSSVFTASDIADCNNDFGVYVGNKAPFAVSDIDSTLQDVSITTFVVENDFDPNENIDSTSITVINPSINGTTSLTNDSLGFQYLPDLGFYGWDSFTYSICDTGSPVFCDTAKVSIFVACINDSITIDSTICAGNSVTIEGNIYSTAGTHVTVINKPFCDSIIILNLSIDNLPSTANAGADQALCNTSNFTMAASSPSIGLGIWSVVSGSATITTPTSATSNVTGVSVGSSVTLRWTVSNGVCASSTDDVILQNDVLPTSAAAGLDQILCNTSSFAMSANSPIIGTGTWSIVSGSASISAPSSPTSTITGVAVGSSVALRWTISNGVCASSTDDVIVQNNEAPSLANAGADQSLCNTSSFVVSAIPPSVGTGVWSLINGSATIINPTSTIAFISDVTAGNSVTLRWTVSNGVCASSTDDVILQNDELPTIAMAGLDQALCNTSSFTMSANSPIIGTGTWSIVNGSATIASPSSPTSNITGVAIGSSVTLRWTVSNGVCAVSTDDVIIQNDENPSVANAGLDQSLCNTSSFIITANNPSIGNGLWSIVSGSATIASASSSNTTVTGVGIGNSVVLRWTVSNGVCNISTDDVTIQNDELETSNAGLDQTLCNTPSFNMSANSPALGAGVWSLISGSANIITPTLNTTSVTGVSPGSNATLRWTVTNGSCISSDDVVIKNDALASTSSAGSDQTLCNTSSFTMAATAPTIGTGMWSVISGSATIVAPTSSTTMVTGVVAGSNVTLRWTVSNGVCSVSADDVVVKNDIPPSIANAGVDQTLCNTSIFTMAAAVPSIGTGVWSIVNGTAVITTPTSPTTTITGVMVGSNVTLRWTVSNGVCAVTTDDVTIQNDVLPTTAMAGVDQTICNTSMFTMAANGPISGTGNWSIISGSAVISDPSSPTTTITGVIAGTSVNLRWTITNSCTNSTDDVVIQNNELPTVATAGPDQTLCNTASFIMSANAPLVGNGMWTIVSGSAIITTPSSPTTTISGVNYGTSVTLRWTITNGVCISSTDDVVVQNDELPTTSIAGIDQILCNTSTFAMSANTPGVGSGFWSLISGSATITTPTSPTTTITGLVAGTNATLRWTMTNGLCSSIDDVSIQNDIQTISNAGVDQTLCNISTFTMAANLPIVGSGLWSIVNGTAIINTPSSPTSLITGVTQGSSVTLRWTTSNGVCPDAIDDVVIQNDEFPMPAIAGIDQTICNTSTFTMAANVPTVGTGNWTIVSGAAIITTPSSAITTVTNVASQTNVTLRWTLTNGACSSSDDVTIANSNCPPVAVNDVDSIFNNNTFAVDVLSNDSDPEGGVLTINAISIAPSNGGIAVINNNGTPGNLADDYIDYTPSGIYTGIETFEYEICDNGLPVECVNATVSITVIANGDLFATDDVDTTIADCQTLILDVLSNDVEPDFDQNIVSLSITSGPNNGGSATINNNGTATDITDDFIEYLQTGLVTGNETFQYQICDNGIPQICRTANVTINVASNVKPVAMDDTIYVLDFIPRHYNPLDNDYDNCGSIDPSTLSIITPPTLATITGIDPVTGVISIEATLGQVGKDQFTYIVSDYGVPNARGPVFDTAIVYFEVVSYAPDSDQGTFFEGALIVDMGVLPQTVENALKPYGLVFDLVAHHNIPIIWSIKGSKRLGQLDFIHDGKEYYGGPFIIPAQYRSPAIDAVVASWVAKGVVIDTAVHDVSIPVMETRTGYSRACLEKNSADLVNSYFNHAEIPQNEYYEEIFIHRGDLAAAVDGNCCDIYMIPHYLNMSWNNRHFEDLYHWVRGGGHLWAQCQTVSKLENLHDPADTSRRLNFLSTNGMQCYGNNGCEHTFNNEIHANQPIPIDYAYDSTVASSMLLQWYGEFWVASDNGNERWFIPANNSKWRASAVNVLATADTTALGAHGTKNIYGHAWDNPDYGMVMYQAGHNYNPNASGNPSDHVTALRAFFNYLFQVTKVRGHNFEMSASAPECFVLGQPNLVSTQITEGLNAGPFTYQWSSTIAGTFDNANAGTTNFTPDVNATEAGWIIITITDACGRKKFERFPINTFRIGVAPTEVDCYAEGNGSLHVEVLSSCDPVSYLWSTGDTTQDIDSLDYGLYTVQVTDAVGNVAVDHAWVQGIGNVDCNSLLPVELASFYGETKNGNHHLHWMTLSELNNDHFILLRSKDAITFEEVGKVDGTGNTDELQHYSFVDVDPYNGITYYRLDQVDYDGTTSSSSVISLLHTEDGKTSLTVWPNPTSGELNMSIIGGIEGADYSFRIYDMSGNMIEEKRVKYELFNQTTFDLSHLSPGIYLVETLNEHHQFSQKIVVN